MFIHGMFIQEDAVKQLQALQNVIQASMNELDGINPAYEDKVREEKEITMGYVY